MANEIKKIRVDNIDYDVVDEITGYTSFDFVPASNLSNVVVGTMTFNGVTYTIYAPNQDITDTLDIYVDNTNLVFDNSSS